MMRKTSGYPLLSAARSILKLMAVLTIVWGVAELFLIAIKPGSSRVLSDSMTGVAIIGHLVGTAARAFGLMVLAECLRLGLDVSHDIRMMRNR